VTESLESVNSKTRRAYNLAAQRYHDLFHDELRDKEYDRRLLDSFAARFTENAVICDAGCGPTAHIGRYLFDKGMQVVAVDIADRCVELARNHNPDMRVERGDISQLPFEDGTFDGIVAYYSIIDTPKRYVPRIFSEFHRTLKRNGHLLIAAKAGTTEGYVDDLLGISAEIYFTLFSTQEIAAYFEQTDFFVEFLESRNPYDFEIASERIFAIGKKVSKQACA
jgi:SAM-dependent methyltransferase